MKLIYIVATAAMLAGCSTLNESIQLGASMGAFSGAAASYAAYKSVDINPTTEEVASGAVIGLGLGLLTSYLVHQQVDQDRAAQSAYKTEMYFGDLPPSPFVFPNNNKKGGR